jgi:hypothetical protein
VVLEIKSPKICTFIIPTKIGDMSFAAIRLIAFHTVKPRVIAQSMSTTIMLLVIQVSLIEDSK